MASADAMVEAPHTAKADEELNVLLVSLKRSRNFYERATKELFASGVSRVKVSALGEAISTAVELAGILEERQTAIVASVETMSQLRAPRSRKGQAAGTDEEAGDSPPLSAERPGLPPQRTAGIHIILQRHPDFKGSRITPAHVTWCAEPTDGTRFSPIFIEAGPTDIFGSVVSGHDGLSFSGGGQLAAAAELLRAAGHDIDHYQSAHTAALAAAWKNYETLQTAAAAADGRFPPLRLAEVSGGELGSAAFLKAVFCRPCVTLHKTPGAAAGAVFVDIFEETKTPHGHSKNYALIYVVSPKSSDYSSKQEFLDAVEKTGANLMTALCDYNGMVRRDESSVGNLKRLVSVRICAVATGANKHADASKAEVAGKLLSGLDSSFHYGTSPRLNFAYDENILKEAWIEQTGVEVPVRLSGRPDV